jgi:hypothetical protein
MSIPCMQRVWEHSSQKGAALFLLVAIADYATCFRLTKTGNGFAFPGLQTLARKIRMSVRHTSRLVAGLQSAGELLVLPRPGRGHLTIVLTATDAPRLSAALQRAADRGAVVDGAVNGLLDATQDSLSSPTQLSENQRSEASSDAGSAAAPRSHYPFPNGRHAYSSACLQQVLPGQLVLTHPVVRKSVE